MNYIPIWLIMKTHQNNDLINIEFMVTTYQYQMNVR